MNTGESEAIQACSSCKSPSASISGTSSVSPNCGGTVFDSVVFSGTSSTSPSGRRFSNVTWELVSAPADYDAPAEGSLYQILEDASSV
eukprot:1146419-Pelagomonas_calceolata.AAC.6